MAEVASAFVTLLPSARGFGSAVDKQVSPELDKTGGSLGKKFGTAFKVTAAAAIGGVFAAAKLGKEALTEASDLAEASNVVGLTFRKNAPALEEFFDSAATSVGMSESAAKQAAANVGGLLNNMGFARKESADWSKTLLTLAADMGSAFNADPAEAIAAIGSGLRGEAEPLRRFNVMLDEAALKAEAMALGLLEPVKDEAKIKGYQVAILEGQQKYNEAVAEFGKGSLEALKAEANLGTARDRLTKATEGVIPALTKEQKAQAALSLITKQTSDVQGDFANTSDSYANVQRRVSAQIDDLQARLGLKLLPVAEKVFGFIGDKALPWIEDLFDSFRSGQGPLSGFSGVLKNVWPVVRDVAVWVGTELVPALRDLAGNILAGARDGFTRMKEAIRDNRPFIDKVVEGVGALAQAVVDHVLPALGKFFRIYLPAVAEAIGVVIKAAKLLSIGWLEMVAFGSKAFAMLLDAAFFAFDKILGGVEKAFFWNPAVSAGAKAARAGLDNLREDTVPKLKAIEDTANAVADAIRGIPDEKKIRISVSENVSDKVGVQLARFDPVAPNRLSPAPRIEAGAGRSGNSGPLFNVEKVEAQDVNHFLREMEARTRAEAMGAADFR